MKKLSIGATIIILAIIIQAFSGYHWLRQNDIAGGLIGNEIGPGLMTTCKLDQADAARLFEAINSKIVFDTTSNPGHIMPLAMVQNNGSVLGFPIRITLSPVEAQKSVTVFATRPPENGGKGLIRVNGIVREVPEFFSVLSSISKEHNFDLSKDAKVG